MPSLFLNALLGAAAVAAIALLSKSKAFFVAGLVPLFPTLALIAHAIVGGGRSPAALRTTALFGLFSLILYAACLVAVYVGSVCFSLIVTLASAMLVWAIAAGLLLLIWTRVFPVM